jgi:hypothetical protein
MTVHEIVPSPELAEFVDAYWWSDGSSTGSMLWESIAPGTDVVVQRRKTFYGSTEMIVRDAVGNVVVLAEMEK